MSAPPLATADLVMTHEQEMAAIATYLTLCEAVIKFRPLKPDEWGAYMRAIQRIRCDSIPIPACLRNEVAA